MDPSAGTTSYRQSFSGLHTFCSSGSSCDHRTKYGLILQLQLEYVKVGLVGVKG